MLILLLTVVDQVVAQFDLVHEWVSVESLELAFLPLLLLLFLFLAPLQLLLTALFLALLQLLLALLSLLLPPGLLFLPLFLLLFTLDDSLLDPGHPFDVPDLNLLALVGKHLLVVVLTKLELLLP